MAINAGTVAAYLELDTSKFTSALQRAGQQLSEFSNSSNTVGQRISSLGGTMTEIGSIATKYVTLPIAGIGVASLKASADFEQGMANVKAVSGATGEQMDDLSKLALQMGKDTSFGATDAAKGMEELVKAGISLDDILGGALQGSLDLAAAGELELGEAAEIASTVLNAFKADNLSVAQSADILAGAANASATSVQELKYGLSASASVASSVGLSFKDTSTALAVFASNGLKGSDAGTSLKTMLMNLQPQTKAQKALFEELGLVTEDGSSKFFDANGKLRSMSEIAEILQGSMKGLTDAQRLSAMETLFGSDAIRAANILYKEGSAGIQNMQSAMSNVTAQQVATEKMNTLKGSVEQFKGSLETAGIVIGNVLIPTIRNMAEGITNLTNKFLNLSPGTQEFIVKAGMIVAAIGPVILIAGQFARAIGSLITGFSAISTAITAAGGASAAFGAVITAITGPIGIAIAAIVAIGTALVLLYKHNEEFRNKVNQVWSEIKVKISGTIDALKQAFQAFVNFATPLFYAFWSTVKYIWASCGQDFINILKSTVDFLGRIITTGLTLITNVLKVFTNILKGDWRAAWNDMKQLVSDAFQGIKGILNAQTNILKSISLFIWNGVKSIVEVVWNSIKITISSKLSEIAKGISSWYDSTKIKIAGKLNEWWTVMSTWFSNMPSKISAKLVLWWNSIGQWYESTKNNIKVKLDSWWISIGDWFNTTKIKIINKLNEWKASISQWFDTMPTKIKEKLISWGNVIKAWTEAQNRENVRQFGEWGNNIIKWFSDMPKNISQKLSLWKSSIESWFNTTKITINNKLSEWWNNIGIWFGSTKEKIKIKLAEWGKSISDWYTNAKTTIKNNLNEWWNAKRIWFDDTKRNIKTKLSDWWTSIGDWFNNSKKNISVKLAEWWQNMGKWYEDTKRNIKMKLDGWWDTIKNWFKEIPNKLEIKNSGKNMVDKMAQGSTEKKKDFMDKLGKMIVDALLGALAVIGVALIATGREIIKRVISGVTEMKAQFGAKFTEVMNYAKQIVINKINDIKNLFKFKPSLPGVNTSTISSAYNTVSKIIGYIKKLFNFRLNLPGVGTAAISSAYNTVSRIVGYIRRTFSFGWSLPGVGTWSLNSALSSVYGIVSRIKSAISGAWLQLPSIHIPHISLPHFTVRNWSYNPADWVFNRPYIDINWYDKGGIFNSPSIIGVGEKRPEFVGALEDLNSIVTASMRGVLNTSSIGTSGNQTNNVTINVTTNSGDRVVRELRYALGGGL